MSDLISRQAAIDALIRKTRPHDNGDGTTTIYVMSEGLVREVITDLPTAEKKGKWIDYCGGVKCDQCGFECDDTYYLGEANFCPNCGARMEE